MLQYLMLFLGLMASAPAFEDIPQALKKNYLIPQHLAISAKNYILVDADTQTVIVSYKAEEHRAPASLTKMMSAHVVSQALQRGVLKWDDIVEVSKKAAQTPGSRIFLSAGDRLTVKELLRGAIIASGNDATVALAEYIGGSEDNFVEVMNEYAEKFDLKQTHFVTSTGLPAKNHYSTAVDMAKLGLHVVHEDTIYPFYAEKWFTYKDIKQNNRNRLLWRDDSVDGIKSGHTDEAGYCLVTSAKKNNMRLVGVIMGSANESARDRDSQKLLDYGFRFFEHVELFASDAVVSHEAIRYGEETQVALVSKAPIRLTIPKGASKHLQTRLVLDAPLEAPIDDAEPIAHLEVELHKEQLGSYPLYAQKTILASGWLKRQGQYVWEHIQPWMPHS